MTPPSYKYSWPHSLLKWSANARKNESFFWADSSCPEQTLIKITWTIKIQRRRIFHDNLIALSTRNDWDVNASQYIYVRLVFLHPIAWFNQTFESLLENSKTYVNFFNEHARQTFVYKYKRQIPFFFINFMTMDVKYFSWNIRK